MLSYRGSALLFIALFAAICFHIATLSRYPSVFVDEVWLVSRAWAWLQTGSNFGPLDAGVYDKRLEGYDTFYPIIPTLLVSIFVRYFGLAIEYLRVLPLLLGFGLLAASYSIAYQLSGSRRCGLIAALLLSMSVSFLISAHMIRYDIIVAALGYGAMALAIASCRRHMAILSFLSGLMLSAAFEVHMNAAVYGPVLLVMFVAYERWEIIRSRQFGAFIGGVLIGLAAYIWLHVAPHPNTYFAMGAGLAATHRPPLLSNIVESLNSLIESGAYFLEFTAGRIIVALIAAWLAYKTRITKMKLPGYMLLAGCITFSFLIRNKAFYYMILISPLIDIFLAIWIRDLANRVNPDFWQKRAKAIASSILLVSLVVPVYVAFWHVKQGDWKSIGERVKQAIPKGATIMGPPTYWLLLHEHRYLGWMQYIVYKTFDSKTSIENVFRELRPNFLIFDADMRQYILPDQKHPPRSGFQRYLWERRLPKQELDSFLLEHGKLVDSFDTPAYGEIQIFSLDWNKSR